MVGILEDGVIVDVLIEIFGESIVEVVGILEDGVIAEDFLIGIFGREYR